jgi:hypothetical protein
MTNPRSPGREGHPISLAPLTPEEALRRAMQAPVPKHAPKPPAKPKAKKKAAKKRG